MDLFKIEDFLAEYRHYTRRDILEMPYYELSLKLGIIKEREQAKKDENARQNREHERQNKQFDPRAAKHNLKAPKMPSFKAPKIR